MPDILIRGMDKPGGCADCDFCEIQDINFELLYYCNRTERFIDEEEACNIPSDCPIIELPPHGDLIDMDKIRYTELYGGVEVTTANWIGRLPVVVPADKEVQDALS